MDIISKINDLLKSHSDFCLATVISSSEDDPLSGCKCIILSNGTLENGTGIKDLDDFTVHYASIHLCTIRYMLVSGASFGTFRNKMTKQLELLTLARLLWEL